jgi:ribosomal-protein-alanine N-acetyltransferase
MLAYLHRAAVTRGRDYAYLEVRESNVSAQELYKKFGYRPIGRRKNYYPGDREDAILMYAVLRKGAPPP